MDALLHERRELFPGFDRDARLRPGCLFAPMIVMRRDGGVLQRGGTGS